MDPSLTAADAGRSRAIRGPVLEISDDLLRVSVPLGRSRRRMLTAGMLAIVGGFGIARLLIGMGVVVVAGITPIGFLVTLLLGLFFESFNLVFLVPAAYLIWGVHVVTVAHGEATMRLELWGRGYRHSQVAVGPGSRVEVVFEEPTGAHLRIEGHRTGAGLKPAGFEFAQASLTVDGASQIADRLREAIGIA